jgi:G3E family GTPase
VTRIPVFVIGGYLGVGKTTFINECLNRGLQNAAIIVNDFGEINIDASIISARHGDTLELSNGCVCCSIGTSLADTLFTVLDRPTPPEMIIIEASGVADPGAVAAFTHLQGLVLAGNIVLVDSVNAIDTAANPILSATFERQVRAAHVLALTKSDIATPEQISATRDLVTIINPDVAVVVADAVALSELVVNHPAADPSPTSQPTTGEMAPSIFASRVHHFDTAPAVSELRDFLASLPQNVVRAKGVVATSDGSVVLVQKSGAHVSITPTLLAPTGLVIITAE